MRGASPCATTFAPLRRPLEFAVFARDDPLAVADRPPADRAAGRRPAGRRTAGLGPHGAAARLPVRSRPSTVHVDVDPLADPRWTALVERAPDGSVFHHPAWLRLLRSSYRYRMSACCLASTDGELVAGLPLATVSSRLTGRRLVALPFSDLCPPLFAPRRDRRSSRGRLDDALGTLQRSCGLPLEIRAGGGAAAASAPGERFHHHVLRAGARRRRRCSGASPKPQVLRGVRRARREGLVAEARTDRAALAAFYRLHVATRQRLGVPTQPRRFILGLEPAVRRGPRLRAARPTRGPAGRRRRSSSPSATPSPTSTAPRTPCPRGAAEQPAVHGGDPLGLRARLSGRSTSGALTGARKVCASSSCRGAPRSASCATATSGRLCVEGSAVHGASAHCAAVIRRSPPLAGRLIGEVLYRHAG